MTPRVLILSENGAVPRIADDLRELGCEVHEASNQRRAVKMARQVLPDIVVAAYIFTPDFRDRISNLDTLCSQMVVHKPDYSLVIVHEPEDRASLERFQRNYTVKAAFPLPVDRAQLLAELQPLL